MKETRSQLIWRHVHRFINSTSASWPTYATEVREHYERLTPPTRRLVEFGEQDDPYARMRANAQTVRRFDFDYEHHIHDYDIPADLEEAMVLALGSLGHDGYPSLMAELAARYGLLAAAIPAGSMQDDVIAVASLLREAGEDAVALAPLLEGDNQINHRDREEHLEKARTELMQTMGVLASLEARVSMALREKAGVAARVRVVK